MIHLLLVIIYLSFVSLGLPDALLGAAWPIMCQELEVPVSMAGGISMIVALGTIVSSLLSDRLTRTLGTGKVTAISVGLTALALLGFSMSRSYWMLCLWAIPYGLGAGSVDASLNNYVAIHYASRHMSWLHCMWGVGASIGPSIMGFALGHGLGWTGGYRVIALLQGVLTAALVLTLPMWKAGHTPGDSGERPARALSLGDILAIPGAKEVIVAFLSYCAVEQTCILWGSSYLVLHWGVSEDTAAALASLFMLGIMGGRFFSGFLTYRFSDERMIRLGQGIIALGIAVMLLPLRLGAMAGLLLIGLGCAPIYPSIIHSTPAHFGPENSQALIGVQMAGAYVGTLLAPPLFGIIANHLSPGLLPAYLAAFLALMTALCERLNKICKNKR